jgi:tRNA-specific 2-thiouridylase
MMKYLFAVRYNKYIMSKNPSVLIAMSGGVDSSVAAALLHQQGYDCTGVFMCLGQAAPDAPASHHGCCSPQDSADAKQVASSLGIKFAVLDFHRELEGIIDYFVNEYRNARTPNPCILCNSLLKFGKLMQYASLMDIDYVATGHYARIAAVNGRSSLMRGIDDKKDQSYALFNLPKENLPRILLPLGIYTKTQVRKFAADLKLPVHDKPESQEICFVSDNNYANLILQRAPQLCRPGPVVDVSGKKIGRHNGIFNFTIGQRRGLGIALGKPAYVVRLDAATNTVVLGSADHLRQQKLFADNINWLIEPPPDKPFKATVQIRYNHRGAPATVTPLADNAGKVNRVVVDFDVPVTAVTPGQAAVFYDNDLVIGGGWIENAEN